MQNLQKQLASTTETTGSAKRRAVGTEEPLVKQLVVQTAKALVGVEARSRRVESALSQVALLPDTHPYLQGLQEAGKAHAAAAAQRKAAGRSNSKSDPTMPLAHERTWIALCTQIAADKTLEPELLQQVGAYTQNVSEVTQLRGTVHTCYLKKAFRQSGWTADMHRLE
eukprot:1145380-Amphidinium_carterae.1